MDPLYIAATTIAQARKQGHRFTLELLDVRFQRMTDGSVTMKVQTGHGAIIRRQVKPAGSVEPLRMTQPGAAR